MRPEESIWRFCSFHARCHAIGSGAIATTDTDQLASITASSAMVVDPASFPSEEICVSVFNASQDLDSRVADLCAHAVIVDLGQNVDNAVSKRKDAWCARLVIAAALFGQARAYSFRINAYVWRFARDWPLHSWPENLNRARWLLEAATPGTSADDIWLSFAALALGVQIFVIHGGLSSEIAPPSVLRFGKPNRRILVMAYEHGHFMLVAPALFAAKRKWREVEADRSYAITPEELLPFSLGKPSAAATLPRTERYDATASVASDKSDWKSEKSFAANRDHGSKRVITCYRCNKVGHIAPRCRALLPAEGDKEKSDVERGKPTSDSVPASTATSTNAKFGGSCHTCGKPGHRASNCRS